MSLIKFIRDIICDISILKIKSWEITYVIEKLIKFLENYNLNNEEKEDSDLILNLIDNLKKYKLKVLKEQKKQGFIKKTFFFIIALLTFILKTTLMFYFLIILCYLIMILAGMSFFLIKKYNNYWKFAK